MKCPREREVLIVRMWGYSSATREPTLIVGDEFNRGSKNQILSPSSEPPELRYGGAYLGRVDIGAEMLKPLRLAFFSPCLPKPYAIALLLDPPDAAESPVY